MAEIIPLPIFPEDSDQSMMMCGNIILHIIVLIVKPMQDRKSKLIKFVKITTSFINSNPQLSVAFNKLVLVLSRELPIEEAEILYPLLLLINSKC